MKREIVLGWDYMPSGAEREGKKRRIPKMMGPSVGTHTMPCGSRPPSLSTPTASFPTNLQLSQQIRELIASGSLKAGQPFWSEDAFAQQVCVSNMTVSHAFQSLRAEGLLVVEKGKQPVVGSGQIVEHFNQLCGFTEEMRRRGLVPSTRLLSITTRIPTPEIAGGQINEPSNKETTVREIHRVKIPFLFRLGFRTHDISR